MATDTDLASVVEAEVVRLAVAIGEVLQVAAKRHGEVEVRLTVIFDPDEVMCARSVAAF